MPFHIIEGDITLINADAIVNAANHTLLGGGGVDGAIHDAAGPGLLKECMGLGGCATGDAKITAGYRLPARHVIHTVGPIWDDGLHGEEELLESCYRRSLELARENGCTSVAFPLISAGIYGFPKEPARLIAERTIREFLSTLPDDEEMHVTLVLYNKRDCTLDKGLRNALDAFIASGGTEEYPMPDGIGRFTDRFLSGNMIRRRSEAAAASVPAEDRGPFADKDRHAPLEGAVGNLVRSLSLKKSMPGAAARRRHAEPPAGAPAPEEEHVFKEERQENLDVCCFEAPAVLNEENWGSLDEALGSLDESFSQMLLRKIRESGMSEPECYRRANLDRKLFSKIRSNIHYRPKKTTVLAFAVALRLSLDETKSLLEKAGFALSHSSVADLIVEYFIRNRIWDILTINDALFHYDQVLLGA